MLAVQSINFPCADFWSPYLLKMGVEILVSISDVNTNLLLSQNWPPSTSVRYGSCRSCSEPDFATTDMDCKKQMDCYAIPKFHGLRKSLATSTSSPHLLLEDYLATAAFSLSHVSICLAKTDHNTRRRSPFL